MNMLNEEIRAIKHTIVHLRKGMVLEPNQGKRDKMKKSIKELDELLIKKLEQCGDFKG